MDDVGGQRSSNEAMRGVRVVQEPDLQRNQAFAAQVDGLYLLLLLPVPHVQITAVAGGNKHWVEALHHHSCHNFSRRLCSCELVLQYIASKHMHTCVVYTCTHVCMLLIHVCGITDTCMYKTNMYCTA